MHMLRLGIQGIEYTQTGALSSPIPGEAGELLRAVRRGEFTLDEVIRIAHENERTLESMTTQAPERPDDLAIDAWLRRVHEMALDLDR